METFAENQRALAIYQGHYSYPKDDQVIFVIDVKKYEAFGVIMTYISWEIHFHTSGIKFPHEVWKKLKSLLDKVDESQVMQLEKELIYLDPHSFERIKDYLACVKELQLKLVNVESIFRRNMDNSSS
jgi:hypothetical protein